MTNNNGRCEIGGMYMTTIPAADSSRGISNPVGIRMVHFETRPPPLVLTKQYLRSLNSTHTFPSGRNNLPSILTSMLLSIKKQKAHKKLN